METQALVAFPPVKPKDGQDGIHLLPISRLISHELAMLVDTHRECVFTHLGVHILVLRVKKRLKTRQELNLHFDPSSVYSLAIVSRDLWLRIAPYLF